MTTATDNTKQTEAYTFAQLFVRVDRVLPYGCEVCGTDADGYYQLAGDLHSADACYECAEQYLDDLNSGVWEY